MSVTETIFAAGLFLLGIAVTHFYYRLSTRKAELSWAHHITKVGDVQQRYRDKIRLMYGRRNVISPTSTVLYIWNSGNVTILREDFPVGHEICITADGNSIRDPRVIRQTNSANRGKISVRSPTQLSVDFDYLDPGDGVSIEFMTDANRDAHGVELKGVIKGRGVIQGRGEYLWFYRGRGALPGKLVHCVSAVVFPCVAVIFGHNTYSGFNLSTAGTYSDIVTTVLFALVGVATIWTLPASLRKIGQPEPPVALVDNYMLASTYDPPVEIHSDSDPKSEGNADLATRIRASRIPVTAE